MVIQILEPLFLGIDLGTAGCKVVLVNLKGEIVAKAIEKYPLYLTENGGAEQNPKDWWNSIVKSIRNVLEYVKPEQIKAIGVTGQWSGTIPIDINGNPLMNAIIWLDSRGEKYIKKLIQGKINVSGYDVFKLMSWIRKTGGAPSKSGKDSLAHILFIKNERNEIYNQTYKFLEPISYINYKLTKKIIASYDIMITHWITDNRNINNIKYDEKLIKIAGLDKEKLPEITSSISVIGKLSKSASEELNLKEGIPVIAGGGDIQTSLIGAGCVENYKVVIYMGTSSWITSHVPFKKTDIFNNIASLPSALPGKYFVAAEQECAGKCLEYLCENFSLNISDLDNLALKSTVGSNGLIFTPWLYGERAPIEDRYVRGVIFNLSLNSKKEDIIHAAYEGISFNIKWIFKPVEKLIKKKIQSVYFAGGCANSKILPSILSNVLGVEVNIVEEPSFVNAKGAALLAALGIGEIRLEDFPNLIRISQVYKPEIENFKKYEYLFNCFVKIYRKNKELFRKLNKNL